MPSMVDRSAVVSLCLGSLESVSNAICTLATEVCAWATSTLTSAASGEKEYLRLLLLRTREDCQWARCRLNHSANIIMATYPS